MSIITDKSREQDFHWYALRAYWNRLEQVKELLEEKGVEYYAQKVLPSYVFVHTTLDKLEAMRRFEYDNDLHRFYVYWDKEKKRPSVIPDKEMEVFKIVSSAKEAGLELLGDDMEKYHKGDKVRVLDGPFKGAEGHVVRIKKDRRLVVTISGIAAMATSYIPKELLEKI
ncbi:MAG: UpxY family transcription antiterminator [Bacteroidales bacterium]|nr:UpxY family transcription antiterminator [Bacteroidales bacterium]